MAVVVLAEAVELDVVETLIRLPPLDRRNLARFRKTTKSAKIVTDATSVSGFSLGTVLME